MWLPGLEKKIIVTDILGNTQKHLWFYTLSGYWKAWKAWKAQYSWNYTTESNLPKYIWEKQVFQKAFPPSADLVERAFPPRLSTFSFFLMQLHQYEFISRRICSEEKNQCVFAWLSVDFECMVIKCQDRGDSIFPKLLIPVELHLHKCICKKCKELDYSKYGLILQSWETRSEGA